MPVSGRSSLTPVPLRRKSYLHTWTLLNESDKRRSKKRLKAGKLRPSIANLLILIIVCTCALAGWVAPLKKFSKRESQVFHFLDNGRTTVTAEI